MHGVIALNLNRKGRKRKSGRRTPNGDLARRPVDYRAMAAAQPHRNWLPAALRCDERAGTVLGCLNLIWRMHEAKDVMKGQFRRKAPDYPGISNELYEAGQRYSVIVGAYLAMANAPRGMSGQGRGYQCLADRDCPAETCICLARTKRFNDAYEAISRAGTPAQGHQAHRAVNWVAIQDRMCSTDHLAALKLGLSALANHFGLTNPRK